MAFFKTARRFTSSIKVRAFSLTEIALALTVIAVLIAAVWVAGDRVLANYRVGLATQQINEIGNKLRDFYTGQNNAFLNDSRAGVTTAGAACTAVTSAADYDCNVTNLLRLRNDFFAADMIVGGQVRNPWRGRYEIWLNRRAALSSNFIEVRTFGLTSASCTDLLSRITATGVYSAGSTAPTAVRRLGSMQGDSPVNAYYFDGTVWRDVTGLALDAVAVDANYENCTGISFWYLI